MINISENMESEVWSWDITELFKAFSMIAENEPKFLKEWELVLNGIKIDCDIGYYIERLYKLVPKNKEVYIEGHLAYPLPVFWADKRARENIMRQIILQNMSKTSTIEPRTEEDEEEQEGYEEEQD